MHPEIEIANKGLEDDFIKTSSDLCISGSGPDKTNEHLFRSYTVWIKPENQGPHRRLSTVGFQHGPVKENGRNGVSEESLLAIVLDRIEAHQKGSYANGQNQAAIEHIEQAIACLDRRTQDREDRGVEGTSKA